MYSQEFIQAEVLVDGQPLTEYPNPEGDAHDEDEMIRFVEAKAGKRFTVRVSLWPGFDFKKADVVRFELQFDQETSYSNNVCRFRDVSAHGETLTEPWTNDFADTCVVDQDTGGWIRRNRSKSTHLLPGGPPLILAEILQSLGCLPRSPSPAPDQTLILQRTEDMLRLSKQQTKERNEEILQLRVCTSVLAP